MDKKQTVLIIEDEPNIRNLMEAVLSKNGFVTVGVDSAEAGIKRIASLKPSIILLDVQLPNMDGLECCRRIRADPHAKHTPIIVVSVQATDMHKIIGLESGADDFIAKPFNHGELLARVKAVLRRSESVPATEDEKTLGDKLLRIHPETRTATFRGKTLSLTPKEFILLSLLVRSEHRILSRDFISTQIWEHENLATSRTIDVHISRLRKKLGKDAGRIETVGKVGYRYSSKTEA